MGDEVRFWTDLYRGKHRISQPTFAAEIQSWCGSCAATSLIKDFPISETSVVWRLSLQSCAGRRRHLVSEDGKGLPDLRYSALMAA